MSVIDITQNDVQLLCENSSLHIVGNNYVWTQHTLVIWNVVQKQQYM